MRKPAFSRQDVDCGDVELQDALGFTHTDKQKQTMNHV